MIEKIFVSLTFALASVASFSQNTADTTPVRDSFPKAILCYLPTPDTVMLPEEPEVIVCGTPKPTVTKIPKNGVPPPEKVTVICVRKPRCESATEVDKKRVPTVCKFPKPKTKKIKRGKTLPAPLS